MTGNILVIDLVALKAEADDILGVNANISPNEAYGMALANLAMLQAEGNAVSPFEARLLSELQEASDNGRPVSSTTLAVRLGIDSRFTMHYHLRSLERRGLVYRPAGPRSKSGWAVAS